MSPPADPRDWHLDFSSYREQVNSYKCPVPGCSQSFAALEFLQYHISQSHTFKQNPDRVSYATSTPLMIGNVNQTGETKPPVIPIPTVQRVSQAPQRVTQFPPPSTIQTMSQPLHVRPSPRDIPAPPSYGQMLPPTHASLVITDMGTDTHTQHMSWGKTIPWPEGAEVLLKRLAHIHALYANPTRPDEYKKLCFIFDEFYAKAEFSTWKPPKEDERLWQLFRGKLDQIQQEMLERGEVVKGSDGILKRGFLPILPPTKVLMNNPPPESLATPPDTPVLGNDKQSEGIELWNGLDVDSQTELFRQQLRNAKNRKGLMLEWNEYCGEVREKRQIAKARDPKSTTPSARSPGSKTPPAPPALPAPEPLATIDVKQIIANKIQELALKRDRDRQQAAEERAAKRLREDPA
ncbi:hypothetical protein ONS95_013416 [Cadophora gregata]|uniref:uncharacterized protein n=1 Tax=Cadophora gregata TaxID=51156 RepID=UPI0026DBD06C|nr:uncharacterized protein ONS95_013416 [Cadophora gregata]KAK0099691.1 hypothetical protein ONS96_008188 [Cadophora gregata f. sp. sojae]KAK0116396.1 hypothetical protein ONS95_013416 [Cadophora gregata]